MEQEEQDRSLDNNSWIKILQDEIGNVKRNKYQTPEWQVAKIKQHEDDIRTAREGKPIKRGR